MALAQLGIKTTQEHLAPQFATRTGLGTLFSNTVRIEALGIRVQLAEWSGMDMILHALEQGQAVIAAIMTTPDLPGWGDLRTQHAVLVIHVDVQSVSYHDPANDVGPTTVSRDAFHLAWSEMEERVALLSRK
jgi:ABC-type bacteriocin/lantibiotic exporter with double-glycine peptidase domain